MNESVTTVKISGLRIELPKSCPILSKIDPEDKILLEQPCIMERCLAYHEEEKGVWRCAALGDMAIFIESDSEFTSEE